MLIVDRFEDEYVVCEDENKKMINIKKIQIEGCVKEGDILLNIKGKYIIDIKKTINRKKHIEELTKDLWEN